MTVPATIQANVLPERLNAIGLIGVSSNPNWLSTMKRIVAGKAHAGDTSTVIWRVANVLYTAIARDSQQLYETLAVVWNGHTAMLTRIDGALRSVVGWNPNVNIIEDICNTQRLLQLSHLTFGNPIPVPGRWFDDLKMTGDPTAISLEIPVGKTTAKAFDDFIRPLIGLPQWKTERAQDEGSTFTYCFDYLQSEPNDRQPNEIKIAANCAVAGIDHLVHFMQGRIRVSTLADDGSGMRKACQMFESYQAPDQKWWQQGRIMQAIPGWQEEIDAQMDRAAIERQLHLRR